MRAETQMLLIALLPLGCGAAEVVEVSIAAVEPATVSARGGERVQITGSGFAEGAEVRVGALPGEVVASSPDRLEVVVPSQVAGEVTLSVLNPDATQASLEAGLRYQALDLELIEAPAHVLPDLAGTTATDVAVADYDGDGDRDLLLALRDAPSRLLVNGGYGSFLDEETAWSHDVAALEVADFDGDGAAETFLCNRNGQAHRLIRGLTVDAQAFEEGAIDGCQAAAVADFDGDGQLDVVVAGRGKVAAGESYLRVYRGDASRFVLAAELEPDAQEIEGAACDTMDCGLVEIPAEGTAALTLTGERFATGACAGRAVYDFAAAGSVAYVHRLPRVGDLPSAVELELFGDAGGAELSLRLTDAADQTFVVPVGPVDWQGWKHLRIDDLTAWEQSELPPKSLALVVMGAAGAAGELVLDDLALEVVGVGRVLVEDFERKDFTLAWPEVISAMAAGDLDGDGDVDLVLASHGKQASEPLRVILNDSDPDAAELRLRPSAVAAVQVDERIRHVALVDYDGDGDEDILAVSAADGQDRLLLNDGSAHFFDVTLEAMPVDRASGRHATVADFDLDGHLDAAIANDGDADRLYLGRGDGFADETPRMPIDAARTGKLLTFDADADGDLDLFALGIGNEPHRLYVSVDAEVVDD